MENKFRSTSLREARHLEICSSLSATSIQIHQPQGGQTYVIDIWNNRKKFRSTSLREARQKLRDTHFSNILFRSTSLREARRSKTNKKHYAAYDLDPLASGRLDPVLDHATDKMLRFRSTSLREARLISIGCPQQCENIQIHQPQGGQTALKMLFEEGFKFRSTSLREARRDDYTSNVLTVNNLDPLASGRLDN